MVFSYAPRYKTLYSVSFKNNTGQIIFQCRQSLMVDNICPKHRLGHSVQTMFWGRKDSGQITSHWGRTIYEGKKPLGEGQYIRAERIWGRYLSRSDNVSVQTIS